LCHRIFSSLPVRHLLATLLAVTASFRCDRQLARHQVSPLSKSSLIHKNDHNLDAQESRNLFFVLWPCANHSRLRSRRCTLERGQTGSLHRHTLLLSSSMSKVVRTAIMLQQRWEWPIVLKKSHRRARHLLVVDVDGTVAKASQYKIERAKLRFE
jgi:hypothetical protein